MARLRCQRCRVHGRAGCLGREDRVGAARWDTSVDGVLILIVLFWSIVRRTQARVDLPIRAPVLLYLDLQVDLCRLNFVQGDFPDKLRYGLCRRLASHSRLTTPMPLKVDDGSGWVCYYVPRITRMCITRLIRCLNSFDLGLVKMTMRSVCTAFLMKDDAIYVVAHSWFSLLIQLATVAFLLPAIGPQQICEAWLRLVVRLIANLLSKSGAALWRCVNVLFHDQAWEGRVAAPTLTALGGMTTTGLPHLLLPRQVLASAGIVLT